MSRIAAAIVGAMIAACGEPESTSTSPSPSPSPSPSESTSTSTSTSTSPSTSLVPDSPVPSSAPAPVPSSAPALRATPADSSTIVAAHAPAPPTLDGDLSDSVWPLAAPTSLATDYAGQPVASPATTVRLLWTDDALFVAFEASFEPPLTAPDAPTDVEYPHLYGYDVVEIFVDADPSTPQRYREIELGPRGHVLDVAVDLEARPHGDVAWPSGVTHAEHVDDEAHRFTIEARIPASALELATLTPRELRVGLFRITSHAPAPRLFLARFPTLTPRPNFHVPERFGTLRLAE